MPFKYIERTFGLLGLAMLVFVVAAIATHFSFREVVSGLVPSLPTRDIANLITNLYFAVGIISSTMMPYEVYFYSSGGIEEEWTAKDVPKIRLSRALA